MDRRSVLKLGALAVGAAATPAVVGARQEVEVPQVASVAGMRLEPGDALLLSPPPPSAVPLRRRDALADHVQCFEWSVGGWRPVEVEWVNPATGSAIVRYPGGARMEINRRFKVAWIIGTLGWTWVSDHQSQPSDEFQAWCEAQRRAGAWVAYEALRHPTLRYASGAPRPAVYLVSVETPAPHVVTAALGVTPS